MRQVGLVLPSTLRRMIPAPLEFHHTPRNSVNLPVLLPVMRYSVATPKTRSGDTDAPYNSCKQYRD